MIENAVVPLQSWDYKLLDCSVNSWSILNLCSKFHSESVIFPHILSFSKIAHIKIDLSRINHGGKIIIRLTG